MNAMSEFPNTQQEEQAAIAKLEADFKLQKAAFLKDQYPDADTRIERVMRFHAMFKKYRFKIQEAIVADYGNHPVEATDLFESASMMGRAEYAAKNVKKWELYPKVT